MKKLSMLKVGFYTIIFFTVLSILGNTDVFAGTVKINKASVTLFEGKSVVLKLNGTKRKPIWTTANKAIAVVSKGGKVTGKSEGVVTITAKTNTKKYTCKVTVKKKTPSIKSLEFAEKEVILYPEDEFQLKLMIQPSNGSRKGLVYLSKDAKIAGVTTKGKIVAHGIGDTIIYAQSENGKKCSVNVKVLPIPELQVKGESVKLGDTEEMVMKKFGYPDRADLSVYGGKVYIYNNVRSNLLMILMREGKVSGYFTDASVFSSLGITPDIRIEDIPDYFVEKEGAEWIQTYEAKGKYKAHILMDSIGTKVVRGIYVLEDGMEMINNGDAMRGQELEFYDIANSMRMKLGLIVMNWSEGAAASARVHGIDMIVKNYIASGNYEGKSSADRLRDLGISCSSNTENILITNEDAIFAAYRTLNTYEYRVNLVNALWTNLGVGVSIHQDGKFYYVQEYFTP